MITDVACETAGKTAKPYSPSINRSIASGYSRSISLPEDQFEAFRNLQHAKRFAIDIGGSLTKLAYYSQVCHKTGSSTTLSSEDGGGTTSYSGGSAGGCSSASSDSAPGVLTNDEKQAYRLHFIKFETKFIETCLEFIHNHLLQSPEGQSKTIKATGGGSYKYADLIQEKLGLTLEKLDEMECLINGCNFLLRQIPDEVFTYHRHGNPQYNFQSVSQDIYPYLLVNIGSGVSILKVDSHDVYERIGGTATGGGTFWGLGSMLTSAKRFDELLALAEKGDHRKVDMLVKDIYGGDYSKMGLPGDLIASSFGKAMRTSTDVHPDEADVARSLLFTISNDIGHIASLYALQYGLKKIYFGGYFLRGHPLSMHTISYAINYWSKGSVTALFLRHEGYLGAIGAFLKGAEEANEELFESYSWLENYAGSSGLRRSPESVTKFDQLEIDRFDSHLLPCPMLVPEKYKPDTVYLTKDDEAREYWLGLFESNIDQFVARAIASQPNAADAEQRAYAFRAKFTARLKYLRRHPFGFGSLTVRSLLDMREHCLNEYHFFDPDFKQKQIENDAALKVLRSHLDKLDSLDWEDRQVELITSLLAGNVFDWGAQEVTKLLLREGGFGFEEAKEKLQKRPWLFDDLDAWIHHLKMEPKYKCAAFFVDNSGFDIVLGIFPLARELLRNGTDVLLCANSRPALNDVTAMELKKKLFPGVAEICPILKEGIESGRLQVLESGQGSPCLDLSRLPMELVSAMERQEVDLVLLEGMGRAVHTNFTLKFKTCDLLKVAVIKNRWLAARLGGDVFSVMFKFEQKGLEDGTISPLEPVPEEEKEKED